MNKHGGVLTAKKHFLIGVGGLGLCLILLVVLEYALSAPNEATLYYRQSKVMLAVLVILPFSLIFVWRGVQLAVAERKYHRERQSKR